MTEPRASRAPLFVFLCVLGAAAFELARLLAPFLLAVSLGAILSVLLHPFYRRLRGLGWGPRLSAFSLTAGVFLLIVVPTGFVVERAVAQAAHVFEDLSERGELSVEAFRSHLQQVPLLRRFAADPQTMQRQAAALARRFGGGVARALAGLAKGVPRFLLQLGLAVIALYFFLVDGRAFLVWALAHSALDPLVAQRLLDSLRGTAIATVWASLATAAVQSFVVLAGFLVAGVPAPFLAACAAFVLAWVPVVHILPVLAAGAGYLYAENEAGRILILLAAGGLAGVVDNVLRPLILRRGQNIHSFLGLLAVLGGIHLFGIAGVFLGPILAAVFLSLVELWPALAERSGVRL